MNPEITITDTTPWHLREMAVAMQEDSAEIAMAMGFTPLQALWQSYRKSLICKTAFINGKIAAIFGVSGVIFADTGRPWLIMTPEVNEYPMRVAFTYRRILKQFQKMFPILEEFVPTENIQSMRLLELMGFKVDRNKLTVGGASFYRAERRAG